MRAYEPHLAAQERIAAHSDYGWQLHDIGLKDISRARAGVARSH